MTAFTLIHIWHLKKQIMPVKKSYILTHFLDNTPVSNGKNIIVCVQEHCAPAFCRSEDIESMLIGGIITTLITKAKIQ